MFNDHFSDRQQYIKVKNELKRDADVNLFITGNKQKVELDKRLDELSVKGGIVISGRIVRQNIMNYAATQISEGAIPQMVDTAVGEFAKEREKKEQEQEENPAYSNPNYEIYLGQSVNKGKTILEALKNDDSKNTNRNKFNRNI